MEKDDSLTGEQRVLDMCCRLGATDYFNPIGGTGLYHSGTFQERGIVLHFLETLDERYEQGTATWEPFLSMIDVLMFNPPAEVRRLLTRYRLINPE